MIAMLVTLLVLGICWYAPFPIMAVIVIVDLFFPDPIVGLDEIGLVLVFFSRLKKVLFVWNFANKHKIFTFFSGICIDFADCLPDSMALGNCYINLGHGGLLY